jgi:HEAT repeat protein
MSDNATFPLQSVFDLITQFSDPDKQRRADAVQALYLYGPLSVLPLCDTLKNPDGKVRYRAAETLGLIGASDLDIDGEKASTLQSTFLFALLALTEDEADHVRYMAVKALVQIGDPRARDVFEKLRHDEHSYTRSMAEQGIALQNRSIEK